MSKNRLTEAEFARAVKQIKGRMLEKNIELARRYFCDDVGVDALATESGMSVPGVYQICRRIWNAHLTIESDDPDGWERVEVSLPPELATVVKDLEKSARKAYKRNR